MTQPRKDTDPAPQPAKSLLVKIAQELQQNWSDNPTAETTHFHAKQQVLNGTGVVLSANLGRAPLGSYIWERLKTVTLGYSDLDLDLNNGKRGNRTGYLDSLFDAVVPEYNPVWVNNNAAAIMLALNTLKKKFGLNRVVISRGEMVELGGGYRLSEIMSEAGLTLVEVGSTNKTRLSDYEAVLKSGGGILVKVSPNNFSVNGYTQGVSPQDLSFLARKWDMPFLFDAGTFNLEGLKKSPSGASMITLSTDKSLGGTQGGLIMAQSDLQKNLLQNPLYRILRLGKLEIAALEGLFEAFVNKNERNVIPYYQLTHSPLKKLEERGAALAGIKFNNLQATAIPHDANMGGGDLTETKCPSIALKIKSKAHSPQQLQDLLRSHRPAVICLPGEDAVLIDLLTILPQEDEVLKKALLHLDTAPGYKTKDETKPS